jgi:hypothetical protein
MCITRLRHGLLRYDVFSLLRDMLGDMLGDVFSVLGDMIVNR